MRREEDEQCGNESMWKRRRTLDQEREQELPCLQQVDLEIRGEMNGCDWFGEMVEECKDELPCFRQVDLEIDGGMRDGIECVNGLHEECRKEFPGLFQVMGPGKNLLMKSEEGSQKTGIHRAFNEEREAGLRSLFKVHDYFLTNFKFNRRCWI